MQPKIYLCQSEGRSAPLSACFYLESSRELYGWRLHSKGHRFAAAFFMLENFYESGKAALYRSVEDDVYGPWMSDYPRRPEEIRCPLPEPVQHELERRQFLFLQEWLFFENDPDAENEIALYDRQHLSIHAVNIKFRKLGRLARTQHRWEYRTPGFDPYLLDYLQKHLRFTDILTEKWPGFRESRLRLQGPW
jgi:hypothetical protein